MQERRQVNKLVKDLSEGNISVEQSRLKHGQLGEAISEEGIIKLDKRHKGEEKVITLLHEALHLYHPEMSEDEVERKAFDLYRKASDDHLDFLRFISDSENY